MPHRTFHKGPSLSNYNSTLGVHYFSLKYNHLYTRGIGTKPNHNHLYTRGIRHKDKTQSPLHKRDKVQSQNTITSTQVMGTKPKLNHNHLYIRGIRHKVKTQTQSPLHKRDRHKAKAKKRLQSW